MTDLPTLEWEPSEFGGWEADLGVVTMHVHCDPDPMSWSVHWGQDECATGLSGTVEQAKDEAAKTAETILEQALATLRRKS